MTVHGCKLTFLYSTSFSGDYWLGLSDLREEGTWEWMTSNEVISASGYTNWGSGQPDNWHGNEDCAFYYHSQLRWVDAPCNKNDFRYICEM